MVLESYRGLFSVGRQYMYRQPCFLATSFSEGSAEYFRQMAQAKGFPTVTWVIRVDPASEHDVAKRCKHVNFVTHSLVPGEQEYLFTVPLHDVTWGVGGAPHLIELDAASDNKAGAEGGQGRWATPAGSEELPLAPWH